MGEDDSGDGEPVGESAVGWGSEMDCCEGRREGGRRVDEICPKN